MLLRFRHLVLPSLSLGLLFLPLDIVAAAPFNFKDLMNQLTGLVSLATYVLFSLAILYFFSSLVKNLWGYDGGNAEQKTKLQQTLFWGILIVFVMVSIWGIISILQQTLGNGFGL